MFQAALSKASEAGDPTPLLHVSIDRAILNRRIGDWHRFTNRKQAGSFVGACPCEYSSGGVQQ
ncbi:MAG: transposase [Verrucomicrobiaceae bacterium]|nr:transposase [Verrucomicrobiaceae bacterium]